VALLQTGPWRIKRGATSPAFRATLRQADKTPVDLSGADHINFVMRQRGEDAPTVDRQATIIQQGDAATGTDVGVFEYRWSPGDTDEAGVYDGEVALYDINGQVFARIPNDGYLEIWILGNLSSEGPVDP